MKRRTALIGTAGAVALAGTGGLLAWIGGAKTSWEDRIAAERHAILPRPTGPDYASELIRYGTLAANSHNTQAWRFVPGDGSITIEPDFARRTPNVDPDDHHLFASMGAAAENIIQAAPLLGWSATARFDPTQDGSVIIDLLAGPTHSSALADAIVRRQCTRSLYDGQPVPEPHLAAMAQAAAGDGIEAIFVSERSAIDAIGALVAEGTTLQMSDPAYVEELKHWLRFSYGSALASGDGLFAATSGNPVLPDFLGNLLLPLVATADSESARYLDQIASSAGLVVFVSAQNDKAHWVAAGRAYQRFALQATALGVKHAFLNQAVEVPAIRQKLVDHLSLGDRRPDLIVRFGYAPDMPNALRRPLADVIA